MRIVLTLLMKFVVCLIAYSVGLDLFFRATVTEIISFSLLVTVVSYFIGDRLLLPIFGNATATIVDFFLAYGVVWIFGSVLLSSYLQIAWGSVLSAAIIMVGEIFLHVYLLSEAAREKTSQVNASIRATNRNEPSMSSYLMEFAEENEENNPYRDHDN